MFHRAVFFAILCTSCVATQWVASSEVLRASNAASNTFFGSTVALSGDGGVMVAGSETEDTTASDSGAAYVFAPNDTDTFTYVQTQMLKAPTPTGGAFFGWDASLSWDGDVLAVSAPGGGPGEVFMFHRNSSGMYSWVATLRAQSGDIGDEFGSYVSVTPDGSLVAVGARKESSSSSGVDGNQTNNVLSQSGAAYLFSRSGSNYTQVAFLKASNPSSSDRFGSGVCAANNKTVAVAASDEDSSSTGVNSNPNSVGARSGAVYLFENNDIEWKQTTYFKASNTDIDDAFGSSIALSADTNTLVVGAKGESSNSQGVNAGGQGNNEASSSGAVYVFVRNTTSGEWSQEAYIKASNSAGGALLGEFAVSVSADGTSFVVGARLDDTNATGVNPPERNTNLDASGAAYIFRRDAVLGWQEEAFLKATNAGAMAEFGVNVDMSHDGTMVAVGAWRESSSTGAAHLFQSVPMSLPTNAPSAAPSPSPTIVPSVSPSVAPSAAPTTAPTSSPSTAPTQAPTSSPSTGVSGAPTAAPTNAPSAAPTAAPTLAPSSAPTFAPDQPLPGGTIINGSAVVTTPLEVVGGVLTINGDLSLDEGSNVTLTDSSIVSTGSVVVSGPLTLQLGSVPMDGQEIQLVSGSSVSGEFSDISVQADELEACKKVTLTQQNPQGNSLSAVISIDDSGCVNIPLVAGAVAGGVLLLAIVIAVIGAVAHKRRNDKLLSDLHVKMQEL